MIAVAGLIAARHPATAGAAAVVTALAGLQVAGIAVVAHRDWRNLAGAAGQFALWWSLPWSTGLVAAGTLPDDAARRAAALTVLVCVLVTGFCVASTAIHGFGARLPA